MNDVDFRRKGSSISYSFKDILQVKMWKNYESDEGYTFWKIRIGKLHIYKSGAHHSVTWMIQVGSYKNFIENAHFWTKILKFMTIGVTREHSFRVQI